MHTADIETAKHTPGPWHWYSEDFSMAILCGETNGYADPFEKHVTTITMCKSCHDHAKKEKREHWLWGACHTGSAANARLIAAAPDLLAALKRMLGTPGNGITPEEHPDALAAIAKAEGK